MKNVLGVLLALALLHIHGAFAADKNDVDGEWEVTTTYSGGSSVARLEIQHENDHYTGSSGLPPY